MASSTLVRYFSESYEDRRLLSLLGGAVISFILSGIIFRLYLHPLARFPGPVLAALTGYYVTYFDIFKDGQLIPQLQKLHERYGMYLPHLCLSTDVHAELLISGLVVRIGPNKVSAQPV